MVVDFQPSLHNSRLNTILQCSSSSARGSTASSPRCLTRRCTRPPAASLTCSSPKASRRASLSQSASARWSHWQAGTYLMHVQACCFLTVTAGLVSDWDYWPSSQVVAEGLCCPCDAALLASQHCGRALGDCSRPLASAAHAITVDCSHGRQATINQKCTK